jgi:hypothetical protein
VDVGWLVDHILAGFLAAIFSRFANR